MSGTQFVWAEADVAELWRLPWVVATLPHLARWASGPGTADLLVVDGRENKPRPPGQHLLVLEPRPDAVVSDTSTLAWSVLDSPAERFLVEGLGLLGAGVSSEWVVDVPPGTDVQRVALAHLVSASVVIGMNPVRVRALYEAEQGGHWVASFPNAEAHVDIVTTAVSNPVTRIHAVSATNTFRAVIPALDEAAPAEVAFFGEAGARRAPTRWESSLRNAMRNALTQDQPDQRRLEMFRIVSQLMKGSDR